MRTLVKRRGCGFVGAGFSIGSLFELGRIACMMSATGKAWACASIVAV